jgi:hypothetical protein
MFLRDEGKPLAPLNSKAVAKPGDQHLSDGMAREIGVVRLVAARTQVVSREFVRARR